MTDRIIQTLFPGDGSSHGYAAGWRYAEWWMSKGGGLSADPCDNWTDARANGFYDRLQQEREFRSQDFQGSQPG